MIHSVVITTCDRETEILKQSIMSVLNQRDAEIEIIVVNDSPNSKYRNEVDSLINSFGGRLKYVINSERKGANYSRNIGASMSGGDTISFLDDDDYWDANRIGYINNALSQGHQIIYTDIVYFDEKKKKTLKKRQYPSDKVLENLVIGNYIGGFSNVTMEKKCFIEAGCLDESLPSYQDIDLWIRFAMKGYDFYHIDMPLLYYRDSVSSISRNSNNKLNGLNLMMQKYKSLFDKYPGQTNIRIESEMLTFLKNGWFKEANQIMHYLRSPSIGRKFYIYVLGVCKYLAVNCMRVKKKDSGN